MSFSSCGGNAEVSGRTRHKSQEMFRESRCSVESCVGRMIQRITRDMMSGFTELDCRVDRNVRMGLGVV